MAELQFKKARKEAGTGYKKGILIARECKGGVRKAIAQLETCSACQGKQGECL